MPINLVFLFIIRYNTNMKKFIVDKNNSEKKLNKFLFDNIPNLTSNLFYKTLRKKDIKINGKRTNKIVDVFDGDVIEVYISSELLESKFKLDVFFEDENILIINKPYKIEVTGANS